MNYQRIGIITFAILAVLPIYKISAQTTNAGFIPGNIWYSKDPFEEGDKIKIYTLIFNPDSRQLSGTVDFFDKTILLGKKTFAVPAKGVKDISIDWTVEAGNHTIFGKIENAKFLISAGKYENANLTENQTEESSRTVNKKIIPVLADLVKDSANSGQIQNVQKLITENTPDFISKPIILTANGIEKARENASIASEKKKTELNAQIKTLNNEKTPSDSKTDTSKILKPWKYVELFFVSVFSIIVKNRLIFYPILAIIIFLIIRYIWRLIF
jgi:hypothetical protein